MKQLCLRMCLIVGLGAAPMPAFASGSYTGRPPKPPEHIDASRYELGKNLVLGNLAPSGSAPDAAKQSARLKELQGRLPRKIQSTVNLAALGGKLSADQQGALEYYLSVRYKVK